MIVLFDRICPFWLRSASFCCSIVVCGCSDRHDSVESSVEIIPPRPRNHVSSVKSQPAWLGANDHARSSTTTISTLSDSLSELSDGIADRELMIQILHRISTSKETFLAPRPHGPAIEYSGPEFGRMLKSKWEWFGSDIHAIDQWIEEIATRSFRYYLPYMVKKKTDGENTQRTLVAWIAEEGLYSLEKASPTPSH